MIRIPPKMINVTPNLKMSVLDYIIYKNLTGEIKPFQSIYQETTALLGDDRVGGNLGTWLKQVLWKEIAGEQILIFIRANQTAWWSWKDKSLTEICSREEYLQIRERYREQTGDLKDEHIEPWLMPWMTELWMRHCFKQSVTRTILNRLITDYKQCLEDAKQLYVTMRFILRAIRDGLEASILSQDDISKFGQDLIAVGMKTSAAYKCCISFLSELPKAYLKGLDSSIAVERNFLRRYDELSKYFNLLDRHLMEKFLSLMVKHAKAWTKKYSSGQGEFTGQVYVEAHDTFDRFQRRSEDDLLEHFLNATLGRAKHHALEEPGEEKVEPAIRDEMLCPGCSYDCKLLARDDKSRIKKRIICPKCGLRITVADAWGNYLVPWSELPAAFKRTPGKDKEDSHPSEWFLDVEPRGYIVQWADVSPEGSEISDADEGSFYGGDSALPGKERAYALKIQLLDDLIKICGLTHNEKRVINYICTCDSNEITMTEAFERLAKKTNTTAKAIEVAYYKAVAKLKIPQA